MTCLRVQSLLSCCRQFRVEEGQLLCDADLRLEQCENDMIFDRILSRMMDWTQFVEIDYDEEAEHLQSKVLCPCCIPH